MNIKNWIWTDSAYDPEKPVLCRFRKTFELDGTPDGSVFVRVSADTRYRFYVNGQYLCTGPRRGDDKQWFYEREDIRPYLKDGVNVLGAEVLRWPPVPYRGFRSAWRTPTAGLLVYSEDSRIPATDPSWKCLAAEDITVQSRSPEYIRLFQEETVHGSLVRRDWLKPDFDDSGWPDAVNYPKNLLSPSVAPLYMKERTIPLMYEERKRFKGVNHIVRSSCAKEAYEHMLKGEGPIVIPAHSHETVDLLAERLTTAWPELSVSKGNGSVIRIVCSEAYSRETKIHGFPAFIKNDRLDPNQGELRGPADEFHPAGYGTDEEPEYYEPFSFREFYLIRLEIETGDEELIIHDFIYRETAYPLNTVPPVGTDDDSLKDIWRICENTLRMCMHETYEDCPGYEQLQYAMDTRSQILFTYCVSGDDRLARQAIDDFSRSQRPDGLIAACYPSFKSNIIPSFSVYYVLMLYDHMMYFGDRKFLKQYYPSVMRACSFFIDRLNEKYLVGAIPEMGFLNKPYWGYIDSIGGWPAGVVPVPEGAETVPLSLLVLTMLEAAAAIGDYIGMRDLAEEYRSIRETMKEAVRRYCLGKNGLVQDAPGCDMYSQFSQIFAVLNDVLEGEEAVSAIEQTLDGTLPQCSLPVVFYQCRAMEKTGLYDKADRVLDRWRRMLAKNLSTCVEHDFEDQQRSDCHAWSSVPLYEMTSAILGIRPASPGYETVSFEPHPMYLNHAEGEIRTCRGTIRAKWEIKDGKVCRTLDLPAEIREENNA